jgi:hypothetical protein
MKIATCLILMLVATAATGVFITVLMIRYLGVE